MNRRTNWLISKDFQLRYTVYLVSILALATLITGGVAAYFLNQNYSLFQKLAFFHAPDLLPELEREQVWINGFLIAFFVSLVVFNFIFGIRMTSRIAGPVLILKKQIRGLTRGLFSQREIKIRETDEFRDLVDLFNYLQLSLKSQIKRDLHFLETAVKKGSTEELQSLIKEKKSQLNPYNVADPTVSEHASEPSEPSASGRRVS